MLGWDDPDDQETPSSAFLSRTAIKQALNLIRYDLELHEIRGYFARAGVVSFESLTNLIRQYAFGYRGEAVFPQDIQELADLEAAVFYGIPLLGIVIAALPEHDPLRQEGVATLLPLLQSPDTPERWVSALALGYLRQKQAFTPLVQMLSELVPLPQQLDDPQEWRQSPLLDSLANGLRMVVPALLWRWGDADQVRAGFRQALEKTLTFERAIPRPSSEDERLPAVRMGGGQHLNWNLQEYIADQQPWLLYREILLYGLGQLGAFGALAGLDLPVGVYGSYGFGLWYQYEQQFDPVVTDVATMPVTLMISRVQMVLGALGRYVTQLGGRFFTFDKNLSLADAVEQGLARWFALDPAEARRCMHCYERAVMLSDYTAPTGLTATLWKAWDTPAEQQETAHP